MHRLLMTVLVALSLGCGGSPSGSDDAGPPGDGGRLDAAPRDAGQPDDAGAPADAASPADAPLADGASPSAPAFIQANYGEAFPLTRCSVTFEDPVTAGSLLVVVIRMSNGGTATVTAGGRTIDLDKRQLPSSDWSFEVHSLPDAPAGPTTITADVTGAEDQIRMSILELSGVATSAPVHQTSGAEGIGADISAGSVTTTLDDCLLLAAAATDSDEFHSQPAPGPGYTLVDFSLLEPTAPDKTAIAYRAPVAAGPHGGTMTDDQDPIWAAILIAYRPASPGPSM